MSSTTLQPILRPSYLPSLPSSRPSATYVCSQCRHARLLRRPKRPYTFTQLVTLSDGSAFTMRTTSPTPVYRSTRDTRNAPLWNPRSKELLNVEDDDAGKLSAFRARFGEGFDTARAEVQNVVGKGQQGAESDLDIESRQQGDGETEVDARKQEREMKIEETKREKQKLRGQVEEEEGGEGWDFGEDDENMLDLISRFGQDEDIRQKDAPVVKKKR